MSDSDGVSVRYQSCLLTVRLPNQADFVKASGPDRNTDEEGRGKHFILFLGYIV